MDDDAADTADIAILEQVHKRLENLAAAQAKLIAELERLRKTSKDEKLLSQFGALQVIFDYLIAQGIPPGSLLPVLELMTEMIDENSGTLNKPFMEAIRLATASAAITLAMKTGEIVGTGSSAMPGPTARKAANILGDGWTGKKLITHRNNLVNRRSRELAIRHYESYLKEASSWTNLTDKQKVKRMLGYLSAFT